MEIVRKIYKNSIILLGILILVGISIIWGYRSFNVGIEFESILGIIIYLIFIIANVVLIWKVKALTENKILSIIWVILMLLIPRVISICMYKEISPVSDSRLYYNISTIITKQGLINETLINDLDILNYISMFPYVVFYPLMIVPFLKIFGTGVISVQIFNLIINILSGIILYFIVKNVTNNKKNAMIGVMVWALWPSQALYTPLVYTEHIFVFFSLLFILNYIKFRKKQEDKVNLIGTIVFSIISGILAFSTIQSRIAGLIILIAICIYELIIVKEKKILNSLMFIGITIVIFQVLGMLYNHCILNNMINEKYNTNTSLIGYTTYVGMNYEESGKWNQKDATEVVDFAKEKSVEEANKEYLRKTFEERYNIGLKKYINLQARKFYYFNAPDFDVKMYLNQYKNIDNMAFFINIYSFLVVIITLLSIGYNLIKRKEISNISILYLLIIIGNELFNMLVETAGRYSYINAVMIILLFTQQLKTIIVSKREEN